MACFFYNQNQTTIAIPTVEEVANVIFYNIEVRIGEVHWTVTHRYSEFFDLHNQLVIEHGIARDILPAKKIVRNRTPEFVEQRRLGLEEYCQKIFGYFKRTMPRAFLNFFHFSIYDSYFLMQSLALKCFLEVDSLLSSNFTYHLDPLQLNAITECLKHPMPETDNVDSRYDLMHILDLSSQLKILTVEGNSGYYLRSNIIPNTLPFTFDAFKVLVSLILTNVALKKIRSVGTLRKHLEVLSVHNTTMRSISQILQCDIVHKWIIDPNQNWELKKIDFSNNNLLEFDAAITLAPKLQVLVADNNKISNISDYLGNLKQLQHVNLSNNLIRNIVDLDAKFVNVRTLNLSQNCIRSLRGFRKLNYLVHLDLSCNKIVDIDEINNVRLLPCLENLVLTGNTIAAIVDYRIKVFEIFQDRAKDLYLDNEKASQSELDKVSVLKALRIVKEGKTPDLNSSLMKNLKIN